MYRLLIVDENADRCRQTRALLDWSACGITSVITASSYVEAVDKAMDLPPHAALVDMQLGTHTGYDLVAHLHAIGMRTVFCMVSDGYCPELLRLSMRAGARDYLLRPLDAGQLRSFLQWALQGFGDPQDAGEESGETDPVLGVAYARLSKITNKIILIVQSDYRSAQTLTAIAEELNMSGKYIGRIFLRDTGIKFSRYLMAYRMLQARSLIVNTQEKISVIANMVGYAQLNKFYIHFKNYFGVSPSALRNPGTPQEPSDSASQRSML